MTEGLEGGTSIEFPGVAESSTDSISERASAGVAKDSGVSAGDSEEAKGETSDFAG
jgi:hypothetical protein